MCMHTRCALHPLHVQVHVHVYVQHTLVFTHISYSYPPTHFGLYTARALQEGGWVPAYVTNRTGRGVRARPVQGGKEVDVGLGEVYPLKMSHLDKRFMQAEMHGTCLAFAMLRARGT